MVVKVMLVLVTEPSAVLHMTEPYAGALGVEHGCSAGGQELAPGASAIDGAPCPPEQGDTGRGGS